LLQHVSARLSHQQAERITQSKKYLGFTFKTIAFSQLTYYSVSLYISLLPKPVKILPLFPVSILFISLPQEDNLMAHFTNPGGRGV
jgi:hypothetical protein